MVLSSLFPCFGWQIVEWENLHAACQCQDVLTLHLDHWRFEALESRIGSSSGSWNSLSSMTRTSSVLRGVVFFRLF